MLEVRRDGARLEIRGDLDAAGGSLLLDLIVGADGDVQVDGSGLEHIDGAGLTALAMARRECRAEGRVFEVTTLPADAALGLRAARQLPVLFAAPAPIVAEGAAAALDVAAPSALGAARRGRRGRHRVRHRTTREE